MSWFCLWALHWFFTIKNRIGEFLMDQHVECFREEQIDWIKDFSKVVTDCIFLMKINKEHSTYYFIYNHVNKQGMELARLTKRDIGRTIIQSNSAGQAQFIRERYLKVMETNEIVTYKDHVILPNGQYEARTQLIPVYNVNEQITYILGVTINVNQLSEKSDDVKYLNRLFSAYMDTTDNGVALIDFSGKFLLTNETFIRLFGYTKDELLTMDLTEFQPDINHQLESYIQLLKQGEKIHDLKLELAKKDKQIVYTTISFTPIPNEIEEFVAFAAIVHNITDEIETKRMLTDSQNRYQLIAEHTQDLVNIIDQNGIIRYASPSHLASLGYDPSSLVDTSVLDYIYEGDKKGLELVLGKAKRVKKPLLTEFRIIKKSGEIIWLESNIKPVKNGYLHQIVAASRDITNRIDTEGKLKKLAFTDYLTGLPNKREFLNKLAAEKKLADSRSKFMAVCYIDGDEFKKINDTYGHDVGDDFLINLGKRLKSIVHESNLVARIGGDEFAVLLKNLTGEDQAMAIVKNIFEGMKSPFVINNHMFTNSLSIGVSVYPTDDTELGGILLKADQALYNAKRNGKNTYCRYC